MSGPKAPRTFEEWVEAYEERDGSKFALSPGEKIYWHRDHGFFTILYDAGSGTLLVPKMCGDGKYWRPLIYEIAKKGATEGHCLKSLYLCTKRNPAAYMRVIGGTLSKMEYKYDFVTGKGRTIWYISINWENTKEGKGGNDDPISDNADIPAGSG